MDVSAVPHGTCPTSGDTRSVSERLSGPLPGGLDCGVVIGIACRAEAGGDPEPLELLAEGERRAGRAAVGVVNHVLVRRARLQGHDEE